MAERDGNEPPFAAWCRLREERGRRATVIDLYTLVAQPRGLKPHELPLDERRQLALRAYESISPGFELVPGSSRGEEPIEIIPYDPSWPARFSGWRDRIATALGLTAIRIEHVGSTSVPGLPAKPVIDIQISVANVAEEDGYLGRLQSAGLQLRTRESGHRFLRPLAGWPREVHAHVCEVGSAWEREHLLFRDYLREHSPDRDAYADSKYEAARLWRDDRVGYTEAKSELILSLLDAAEAWAQEVGWSLEDR
jgi:GrpB-like predicted nucleotidyltransferase (UPF0157 family)